jgi:hypothetical protein
LEVSRDGGLTFNSEQQVQLFGAFFFMSEEIVDNVRNLYNIISLFGTIGGLLSGLYSILLVLTNYVNRQFIIGKIIRNLYFTDLPKEFELNISNKIKSSEMKPLKFNWRVKLSNWKYHLKRWFAPLIAFLKKMKEKLSRKEEEISESLSSDGSP